MSDNMDPRFLQWLQAQQAAQQGAPPQGLLAQQQLQAQVQQQQPAPSQIQQPPPPQMQQAPQVPAQGPPVGLLASAGSQQPPAPEMPPEAAQEPPAAAPGKSWGEVLSDPAFLRGLAGAAGGVAAGGAHGNVAAGLAGGALGFFNSYDQYNADAAKSAANKRKLEIDEEKLDIEHQKADKASVQNMGEGGLWRINKDGTATMLPGTKRAPKAPAPPETMVLSTALERMKSENPNDPQIAIVEARLNKLTKFAPPNTTNVNVANSFPPMEKKYDTEQGQFASDRLKGFVTAADTARNTLSDVNTMESMLPLVGRTGLGTEAISNVKSYINTAANQFGLGDVVKDQSPIQAFNTIAKRAVMNDIQTLGYNPTDSDRQFAVALSASPDLSPDALKFALKFTKEKSRRTLETNKLAQDWATHFGRITAPNSQGQRFEDFLQDHYSEKPILPAEDVQAFFKASSTGQAAPAAQAPASANSAVDLSGMDEASAGKAWADLPVGAKFTIRDKQGNILTKWKR